MGQKKKLASQIKRIDERLDKIEAQLDGATPSKPHPPSSGTGLSYCSMPRVPERSFSADVSEQRERLIRYLDRKWVNGTKLRFAFFDSGSWGGPESEKRLVREAFDIWSSANIGIAFEEVQATSEAEIRIGFQQSGKTWSYVGRDVIDIPGQRERTMNYGWRIEDDSRGVDVAVHEIGHTLGFPHEHQNPFAGIVWDEDAVYAHFARQGWDRQDTDHNVLRKLLPAEVEGTEWDPDSIMHYGFPAGLILQPQQYRNGLTPQLGLTDSDRSEVRNFYPPIDDAHHPKLTPFNLERLEIGPGQQANFIIEPTETREYTIQTFGRADTLLVLFEDQGGDIRYMAGDDDSGSSLNARIEARLYPNRRYILRVRLYLNWASAETAIMLW